MKTRKREKLEEKTGYTIPDSMHVYRQSQITKVLFIAEIVLFRAFLNLKILKNLTCGHIRAKFSFKLFHRYSEI